MTRAREAGLIIGELPTGPHNAITDVAGVRVGHATLVAGEGVLRPGVGPVRTGVTVILPHDGNVFRSKVCAAVHTINGFGKVLGSEHSTRSSAAGVGQPAGCSLGASIRVIARVSAHRV